MHEVGAGVTDVEVGDTVIVHPFISCGLCRFCRRGDDMHYVIGYGENLNIPTIDVISREISFIDAINDAMADLDGGRHGRGILVPEEAAA